MSKIAKKNEKSCRNERIKEEYFEIILAAKRALTLTKRNLFHHFH